MIRDEINTEVKKAVVQFGQIGMRWAYIINLCLAVIGLVVNYFLPHGWVVWPAVLAIGILVMLNEAVDRNGQGLPPLVVYGWFSAALAGWVAMAFLFSAVAPLLFLVGLPTAAIFGFVTWRRQKKALALADERRRNGLCVNCGEPVVAAFGACGNCGREVDKVDDVLSRVRALINTGSAPEDIERRREVLTPAPPTVAAMRKEKALLERRRTGSKTKVGTADGPARSVGSSGPPQA